MWIQKAFLTIAPGRFIRDKCMNSHVFISLYISVKLLCAFVYCLNKSCCFFVFLPEYSDLVDPRFDPSLGTFCDIKM